MTTLQHINVTVFPNCAVFDQDTLVSLEQAARSEAPRLCEVGTMSYGGDETACTLSDRTVAEAVACFLNQFPCASIAAVRGQVGNKDPGAEGIVLSNEPDLSIGPHVQNSVTFEYSYRSRAKQLVVEESCKRCLRSLVRDLDVDYGYVRTWSEFDRKNRVDIEGGGRRVVGLELPDRLPGLYWANYWGQKYAERIDLKVLEGSRCWQVERLGSGAAFIFLRASSDKATDEPVMAELSVLASELERVAFVPRRTDSDVVRG